MHTHLLWACSRKQSYMRCPNSDPFGVPSIHWESSIQQWDKGTPSFIGILTCSSMIDYVSTRPYSDSHEHIFEIEVVINFWNVWLVASWESVDQKRHSSLNKSEAAHATQLQRSLDPFNLHWFPNTLLKTYPLFFSVSGSCNAKFISHKPHFKFDNDIAR